MLYPKRFGLAGGVFWGISLFILTIISYYTGYANHWLSNFMGIYPGYSISLLGSLLGLVYGFIDGFLAFFVIAWLYNKF